MEYKVSITQKGKVFEASAPEVIENALTSAMYEATQFLEREVKKRTPSGVYGASGGLLSTIFGEVTGKGTPMIKGIVGTGSKYGEVIEKGRTAGKAWPPEGVLLRWIELKLGVDEVQAKRFEFVIRRKIGRKGFPGAFMFERTLDEDWSGLMEIADRHGFEITRELNQ
jgi:orotate phosphoribosyltransferase-like protein